MQAPTEEKALASNRYAWWDDASSTVVIYNKNAADKATAFKLTAGETYFDNLL